MTKIAIITDTHQGVKSDAAFMLDHQEEFYKNVFFPCLIKRGISTVWHLGDLFDRRKYINFQTLHRTREMFLDPLRDNKIQMFIIPGNHDVFHKNTNTVNSLSTLLKEYDNNIMLIERPRTLTFYGKPFMFIPWMNIENGAECIKHMEENSQNAELVCGHFEIEGFEMYRGIKNEHGMPSHLFKNFKQVYSGHFHLKSSDGQITYLGAPFEFTWADYNERKGFHIYDTETGDLEFINNPYTIFSKIYYDDTQEDYNKADVEQYTNKLVQLIVTKKTKPAVYEAFLDKLFKINTIDLKIIEPSVDVQIDDEVFAKSNFSTKELMDTYIEEIETDLDKNKLKSLFSGLYVEALHETESA